MCFTALQWKLCTAHWEKYMCTYRLCTFHSEHHVDITAHLAVDYVIVPTWPLLVSIQSGTQTLITRVCMALDFSLCNDGNPLGVIQLGCICVLLFQIDLPFVVAFSVSIYHGVSRTPSILSQATLSQGACWNSFKQWYLNLRLPYTSKRFVASQSQASVESKKILVSH